MPEIGGHTLWADLQAAYDGLSEPVRFGGGQAGDTRAGEACELPGTHV
jgi:hypothetical protein